MPTSVFTRMKPDSANMVTEPCPAMRGCVDMLCVECGWEGHAPGAQAPWPVFKDHQCRLITESVSTKDF